MGPGVHVKVLNRAAELVGGREPLRELLDVSMPQLEAWLASREALPVDIFLKAVDLISSPQQLEPQRFLLRRFRPGQAAVMAAAAVEAAVAGTSAERGNLQLRRPDGLHIIAHKGFERPFLDFFACVHDHACACGAAMRQRERIIVPDVATHSLFAGSPAAGILAEAGVRAVQSTPLLSGSGELLGMLSTHYARPYQPTESELDVVDRIARRAAFWLESQPD